MSAIGQKRTCSKVVNTYEARAAARHVPELDPTFSVSRFAVTVGVEPKVFDPLAEAWKTAGLPD